jgi:hypothetical protein
MPQAPQKVGTIMSHWAYALKKYIHIGARGT